MLPPPSAGWLRSVGIRLVSAAGYHDNDKGGRAVVYFAEPIQSGYVLIKREQLINVTSPEHERWKRAHPKFCRQMGIG